MSNGMQKDHCFPTDSRLLAGDRLFYSDCLNELLDIEQLLV